MPGAAARDDRNFSGIKMCSYNNFYRPGKRVLQRVLFCFSIRTPNPRQSAAAAAQQEAAQAAHKAHEVRESAIHESVTRRRPLHHPH